MVIRTWKVKRWVLHSLYNHNYSLCHHLKLHPLLIPYANRSCVPVAGDSYRNWRKAGNRGKGDKEEKFRKRRIEKWKDDEWRGEKENKETKIRMKGLRDRTSWILCFIFVCVCLCDSKTWPSAERKREIWKKCKTWFCNSLSMMLLFTWNDLGQKVLPLIVN